MSARLRTIIPDTMWGAHHTLKMPMPGVTLDCRMTLVALKDGTLLMHSPIPITPELKAEIDAIAPVSVVIAPSLFHHLFAKKALKAFPDASFSCAPGLAKKRPDLPTHHVITQGDAPAWTEELEPIFVKGAPMANEVLFYHRPSKSLIVTDILFNMHTFSGAMSPWLFRMFGTHKRFAQSRLWKATIRDKSAYKASIEPLRELEIARVVMAHGDVMDEPDTSARVIAALGL